MIDHPRQMEDQEFETRAMDGRQSGDGLPHELDAMFALLRVEVVVGVSL